MSAKKDKKEEQSFEQIVARLENIAQTLSAGAGAAGASTLGGSHAVSKRFA